jgi:hypothetical protein
VRLEPRGAPVTSRRAFLDEVVFEQMHKAVGRVTPKGMLRGVAATLKSHRATYEASARLLARGESFHALRSVLHHETLRALPYGAHYIPTAFKEQLRDLPGDFFVRRRLKMTLQAERAATLDEPSRRLAFIEKLDSRTREIQDRQTVLQRFYECRVDAAQRYLAVCVLFHAMAKGSSRPWLRPGWQVGRSQSNLRVTTTASPIAGSDADREIEQVGAEVRMNVRMMGNHMRGFTAHF